MYMYPAGYHQKSLFVNIYTIVYVYYMWYQWLHRQQHHARQLHKSTSTSPPSPPTLQFYILPTTLACHPTHFFFQASNCSNQWSYESTLARCFMDDTMACVSSCCNQ